MGEAIKGKATTETYVGYYKALVSELSTWSKERLVSELALEAVTQEGKRDLDAEYVPQIEAARKQSEDVNRSTLKMLSGALSNMTEEAISATKAEIGRKRQRSAWGILGNVARRIYTEVDKARWKRRAADPDLALITSKSRIAKFIADHESLPASAIQSIRKAI